jgi:hypothetical protein
MEWISSNGIRYDTYSGCGEGISKAAATNTAMLKFELLAL